MQYTEDNLGGLARRQGSLLPLPSTSDPPSSSPPPSSSSPPPSSTDSGTSSSSPPPTSSSNPAQPTNSNSNTNGSSSSNTATSATPPPTSSAQMPTTVVSTQFVTTTNAQGMSTTIKSTSTSTGLAGGHHTSTSSSHVAAIAGGTVGGVCGLVILLALAWFLARRRHRDDFNGDFDPDSVAVGHASGGRQSLIPDGPNGAEVTPFVMREQGRHPTLPQIGDHDAEIPAALMAGGAARYATSGQDRQSYTSPSDGGYPQTESSYTPNPYATSSGRSESAYGGPGGMAGVPPRSPTQGTTSVYSQFSQPRSAKEREAYAQRHGAVGGSGQRPLVLATSSEEDESPVVVHQDGGRVPDQHEERTAEREIPPTYDSLPVNERP